MFPGHQTESINNKLGIRSADTAEIAIDHFYVSTENVVGTRNEGFHQLVSFFTPARADVGAQAVGVFQIALDKARAYANERKQFGQRLMSSRRPGTNSPGWQHTSKLLGASPVARDESLRSANLLKRRN